MGIEDRDYYLDKVNPNWRERAVAKPDTRFTCFGCAGLGMVHRGHDGQSIRCPICFGDKRLKYNNPTCSLCPNFVSKSWTEVESHIIQKHSKLFIWANITQDLLNFQSLKPAVIPKPTPAVIPKPTPAVGSHGFHARLNLHWLPTVFCVDCGLHRDNSIHSMWISPVQQTPIIEIPRTESAAIKPVMAKPTVGFRHEFDARIVGEAPTDKCRKCGMPAHSAYHEDQETEPVDDSEGESTKPIAIWD